MGEIILYSTHCPMCMVLERKLKEKGVKYTENNDVEEMKKKGFSSVPVLEVDGKCMRIQEAISYLNGI